MIVAQAPRIGLATPVRPGSRRHQTIAQANKGHSGIHDPVGWGQRGGAVKPHMQGLEAAEQEKMSHLAAQQERSDRAAHPGSAGVDKFEAAQREILAVEQEKAEMRDASASEARDESASKAREASTSDDEWDHMSKPKKWYMEGKALLYSWLKTGVEPL